MTTAPLASAPQGPTADVMLDASGIAKTYGAVTALRDASLVVRPGEIHALMGANGAGKSTLVKILTGAVHPDSGRVLVRGQERRVNDPAEARRNGLVSVYQEPSLIPDLDVRANLRLTETPIDRFREWLSRLGVETLDLDQTISQIPLAILRVMDLARALAIEPDVLLLDEMTAALPADLADKVLHVVGQQRETGRSVIFISHRLLEINALCDRATVLRDGRTVGVVDMGHGAEGQIVELMLGPTADEEEASIHIPVVATANVRSQEEHRTETPRLRISGLAAGTKLVDVSFDLHAGEVLGLAALEGQGQDELFGILSGSRKPAAGTIEVDGRSVQFGHPADAIAAGLVLIPGDRAEGLLPQRSVRENIALPSTARARHWGLIDMDAERVRVEDAIARLQIETRAQGEARRLSGGNQQKVTIARWIARGVETLLCFDPTRGIDIRTKRQIYHLLRDLAASGAAVLLYTSELEEVQLACDRAVVIFGGRVVDEIPASEADEATLTRAAYGLPRDSTDVPATVSRAPA